MAKVVLVTSCKGGIGKSTVAANLSMALAMSGLKVLAVDCDLTMRSLDLIMGLENSAMFSLLDVIRGNAELGKAVTGDDRSPNLSFLAAPVSDCAEVTDEGFKRLFQSIRESGYDYVIVDSPATDELSLRLSAGVADEALIVCSHMPTSIRAAEKTSALLSEYGIKEKKLIINSFDAEGALEQSRMGIAEMIDSSRLMLIGIVPYDRTLMTAQERGELIDSFTKSSNVRIAFINIAARIDGKQLPLFNGFTGKVYKKLSGR